jgi:hypothetical protein
MEITVRNRLAFISILFLSTYWMYGQPMSESYGNEWINKDQIYFKFKVGKDGLYKISYDDLIANAFPSAFNGSQLQVWRFGKEVPLFVVNKNNWTAGDYLLFFGEKNRSELDANLFSNPSKEMLNPEYSMYSDTAVYFITLTGNANSNKRINSKESNVTLPVADFFMTDQLHVYKEYPIDKKYDSGNEITYSAFDECEGFGTRPIQEHKLKLKSEDAYSGNQPGVLRIRLAGLNYNHKIRIELNGTVQKADSFFGYQMREYEIQVPNEMVTGDIDLLIKSYAAGNDLISVSNIHYIYPKKNGGKLLENERIISPPSLLISIEGHTLDHIGVSNSGTEWYNTVRVNTGLYVESKAVSDKIYILNPSNATVIKSFQKAEMTNLSAEADYLIISHAKLMSSAKEYEEYRNSAAGGAFKTKLIDIEQIYNQFGYGMAQVHGLNTYGQYVNKNHPGVKYILLIGRALNYRDLRVDNNAITYKHLNLIPSYGYPGADNLIFAKTGNNLPAIPIGRLAATDNEQVRIYLNKVKEYERKLKNPATNEDLYWRKEILHSAGGIPVGFPGAEGFDLILDDLKKEIEKTDWQPFVTSTNKASSDIIQGSVSNIIINKINSGVSIHTYLGHGAVSATEIGLDDPELFDNKGKYPISFSLGCNSGNIHTTGFSLSEAFIFSPKGSISYLSSSAVGTDGGYRTYGLKLYPIIGNTYYTKSIGEQHYAALRLMDTKNNSDVTSVSLVQQMAIHGDPAIQINYYDVPDFTIDEKSFKTEPSNIFTDQDSFTLKFTLWNLGKKHNQPVKYTIDHILANGTKYSYDYLVLFDSTFKKIVTRLPLPPLSEGVNTIHIKIDPDNVVPELPLPFAESNNELKLNNVPGFTLNVYSNDVNPAYPPDFGIVANNSIELKAFTTNAFSKPRKFIFEIDTTELFNSPLKLRETTLQRGGLITWRPGLKAQNETVYYWRVAADTSGTTVPFIWKLRSFVHVPDKGPGWNQSHGFQFEKNPENQAIFYDINNRSWRLRNETASIVVSSINHALDPAEFSKVLVNGGRSSRNNRTTDAEFMVSVWDTLEGRLILNPIEGRDGAINAFGRIVGVFTFPMDKNTTNERANLIRFLETGIKKGQYVIINNHIEPGKSYFPTEWESDTTALGKTLYSVLEKKGSRISRNLKNYNSYPYVFIYQEGGRVIDEQISTDGLQVRSAFELPLVKTQGEISTSLIGPASEWGRLEWRMSDQRGDQNKMIVLGQRNNRFDTLFTTTDSVLSLQSIDPQLYPKIKLTLAVSDTLKTQSLQLIKWRIYYTGFGDLAIQANENFSFTGDTIDQYEEVRLKYGIQNVGTRPIDSFMVIQSYIDQTLKKISDTSYHSRIDPFMFKTREVIYSTDTKENNQSILIDIISLDPKPEVTLKNNSGKIDFSIVKDFVPPVVDVLFDGKQIMNNDIVARQPLVQISIKDNKDFSLQDSMQYSLRIKFPNKNQFEQIPKNQYTLTTNTQEINIIYSPTFTVSGTYTLELQGQDRSGNRASTNPYQINFKVITENSISAVFPYPNPFTSKCQFAYTLTGEQPSIFKIQIMTVSGKIVRELSQFDLGSLQEGTHLTERSWDGTDEYGNKLATGTYLYRVITKTGDGKSYRDYESLEGNTSTSDSKRFFTKGIGKLVILR